MARILGLVNMHTSPELGAITKNRSLATLPFLGRYAFVDIALSNFSNSNVNTVGILVNKAPRSIIKHMDNAMSYTNNTKLGKTVICYNEKHASNYLYNTDINNIIENEWLVDEVTYKYVIVAPAHILYRMDFNEVIEQHIKMNSVITCVYKKINNGKSEWIDQDIFDINTNGNLIGIRKNFGVSDDVNVSLETYVINLDKLKEILGFSNETSKFFNLKDAINYLSPMLKIDTYEYKGYAEIVKSIKDYLEKSLSLLDFENLNKIVSNDWPIYTKTHDTPPAKYLKNAWVRNSFVSNGAIINGKVENSVICRDVKIKENAVIRNSIILSGAEVSKDAVLEYVIVDKGAKIVNVKELKGTKDNPLYVGQGDVI
ncbi:MAG: glucose-1-phosphate adenylyltransferase subunit GlgD [Erysipelotrichaceae bacterium]|nr:glucose-1-phosphate adenylyltransferase subunit GlgD [Erysipelotrichaceae bacterium]